MRAELLEIGGLGPAAIGRWRELAAVAVEPNPFFEPEFVVPAAAALPGRPSLLVATAADGEWAAAMPVVPKSRWRRAPLRGLISWNHVYSFYGAPLLRKGREAEALDRWLSAEGALRPYLGLDLLDAEGPALAAVEAAGERTGASIVRFDEHERAGLRRDERGMSMRLSSKRRRENARLGRRMGDHLGAETLVDDLGGDQRAVERFLELEASGWKGEQGTAIASDPAHAEFFERMCEGFAAKGRLQFLALRAGERTAAIKCNLYCAGVVFCIKTAFDETLADFSPGVQLERALVDHLPETMRIDLIDTCAEPGNTMANRVWPDRRRIASLALTGSNSAGTLSKLAIRATAKARNTIRRSP